MSNINLGIDISKLELSVALLKDSKTIKTKVKNNKSGFKKLQDFLSRHKAKTAKICMEATGHYGFAVADFLYEKGYAVYVINPFCIKAFGNTQLSRNKTDEADAVIIGQYIKQNKAVLYRPAPKIIRKLRELDKCLSVMKANRAQLKTRIADNDHLPEEVVNSWKKLIQYFSEEIKDVEKKLKQLVDSNTTLKKHYENLQTIPGISSITAITILALVPDISTFINARQLAAFAGLTPQQRSSGTSVRAKTRISKIGSTRLRKAVFFPAMVAKKYNPIIKDFCDNLKKKSKCKMVIIGAAMRKIMHIIFAVLKYKIPFNPQIKSHIN